MSNQNVESTTSEFTKRHTTLLALALVGIATTGYFLGLSSPMTGNSDYLDESVVETEAHAPMTTVIPATQYLDMGNVQKKPGLLRATLISDLRQQPLDPLAVIQVNDAEKTISLAHRETRRAFNGAPPTVPHPIDQLDSAACMACHGEGLRTASLRASKMPHPFYANCTQCHVEQQATYTAPSATFENSFAGAAAPMRGERAFAGAPPVVPHSTWMRNDCLACHGRTAAPGLASTHPWRKNCLQCHAESSQLNQTKLDSTPHFLPGPESLDSNE